MRINLVVQLTSSTEYLSTTMFSTLSITLLKIGRKEIGRKFVTPRWSPFFNIDYFSLFNKPGNIPSVVANSLFVSKVSNISAKHCLNNQVEMPWMSVENFEGIYFLLHINFLLEILVHP